MDLSFSVPIEYEALIPIATCLEKIQQLCLDLWEEGNNPLISILGSLQTIREAPAVTDHEFISLDILFSQDYNFTGSEASSHGKKVADSDRSSSHLEENSCWTFS
ncbi:MAG: hypothetical protein RBR15_13555 [Sphaerochaeta sp.]|nr:hypothetical protein [Sphaerochaeta sp.]